MKAGVGSSSFLETLALRVGCKYLSDLRFLDSEKRKSLEEVVQQMRPDQASLAEWNDSLDYLFGAPPETNPEAAQQQLLQRLAQPNAPVK